MKRPSAIGLTIGIIYALVYLALALGAAGAGHGTFIFFAPLLPYGLGLLFFPVFGFLAGDLRLFLYRVLFLSALALHYAMTIIVLRLEWVRDLSYMEKIWNYSPLGILLPAGWYVPGQSLIRAMFIRGVVFQSNRAS
jgi:hypothetical protein